MRNYFIVKPSYNVMLGEMKEKKSTKGAEDYLIGTLEKVFCGEQIPN